MLVVLLAAKARKRASESIISGDKVGTTLGAAVSIAAFCTDAVDIDAPLKKPPIDPVTPLTASVH
jgi:hypothetical protein